MFLYEPDPGAEPFDLLPRRRDPLPEQLVLALEEPDPLPRLLGVGAAMPALAAPRSEVLLRLQTTGAPTRQLLFDQDEQVLQPLQGGGVRPCVG